MFNTLINLLKDRALTLEAIEENLTDPIDGLKNVLDGLVQMGKIAKNGNKYHGLSFVPEKRVTQRSASVDDYDYPEWVETKKDQVSFWLSEEAELLPHTKTFLWWDNIESTTGKIVYDALHTSIVKHEYVIRPNPATKRNELQHHESHSTVRGIAFRVCEGGKFEACWWDAKGIKHDKTFPAYDEMRKWTLQNL